MTGPRESCLQDRQRERGYLRDLNDRFAHYIQTIQNLESKNDGLQHKLGLLTQSSLTQSSFTNSSFQNEVRYLSDRVIEENEECKAARNQADGLKSELFDLKFKYAKLGKVRECEDKALQKNHQIRDLQKICHQTATELKKLTSESQVIEDDRQTYCYTVEQLRNEIDAEKSTCNFLDEVNQQLKKQLENTDFEHEQSELLNESRLSYLENKSLNSENVNSTTIKYINELRQNLQRNIAEIKSTSEIQKGIQLSDNFDRISELGKYTKSIQETIRSQESQAASYLAKISVLESENYFHNEKLKKSEKSYELICNVNAKMLSAKYDEILNFRNELKEQMQQFQELIDVKLKLDFEIATFKKLLDFEESVLNSTLDESGVVLESVKSLNRTELRKRKSVSFFGADKINTEVKYTKYTDYNQSRREFEKERKNQWCSVM